MQPICHPSWVLPYELFSSRTPSWYALILNTVCSRGHLTASKLENYQGMITKCVPRMSNLGYPKTLDRLKLLLLRWRRLKGDLRDSQRCSSCRYKRIIFHLWITLTRYLVVIALNRQIYDTVYRLCQVAAWWSLAYSCAASPYTLPSSLHRLFHASSPVNRWWWWRTLHFWERVLKLYLLLNKGLFSFRNILSAPQSNQMKCLIILMQYL